MRKNHYFYNFYEVYLCGGRIHLLYVDATVVLARYVLTAFISYRLNLLA